MEHIRLIIWDMDGVKYTISDVFQARYIEAVGKAASQLISGLDFDQAHALAKKSKIDTGRSMGLFVQDYGIDLITLGKAAESHIDIGFLEPSPSFIGKLKTIDVEHMILTDANPVWAERILTQMELADFYAKRHRVTKADYPDVWKRNSRLPFELALKKSGQASEYCLMIEDTPENLIHPKEMGMTTVLIDPTGLKEKTNDIDYIFLSAEAFLDYFIAQRT